MRRIFTLASALSMLCLTQVNAQPTTCSQPNVNVCTAAGGATVQPFATAAAAANYTATGTNGGFLTYDGSAQNLNNLTNGANLSGCFTTTVTTPSFFKGGLNPGTAQAGFTLNRGSNIGINSITLNIVETQSNAIVATCVLPGTALSPALTQTVCFGVADSDLEPNQNFRYQFILNYCTFATGQPSSNNIIAFDNFAYGAGSNAPLPVRFAGLDAKKIGSGVKLTWDVDVELNVSGYDVMRSADGINFSKIGFVQAAGNKTYTFTDASPLSTSFYRIRSVDVDGKFGYSTIVSVRNGETKVLVRAFMSSLNTLTVQHGSEGGRVSVMAADGRIVKQQVVSAGSQQTLLDMAAANSGIYIVRYENNAGVVETIKLIKQ